MSNPQNCSLNRLFLWFTLKCHVWDLIFDYDHIINQDGTGGKHNHLQVPSTCNRCYAAARCDMFWNVKEGLGK